MPRFVRRIFPPSGLPYSLFDASVFVGLLAAFWYVTTPPSETTVTALSDTLSLLVSPSTWGTILLAVAVAAMLCSYGSWFMVRAGYIALACACGAWSASLLFGVLVSWPSWDLAGKTLGSCLVFAWVCRRLLSEVSRESSE